MAGRSGSPRPRVAMLAAHEPEQDPRVLWVAESAAGAGYDALVIGLAHRRPPSLEPAAAGYRVLRLDWQVRPAARHLARIEATLPDVGAAIRKAIADLDARARRRHAIDPVRFAAAMPLDPTTPVIRLKQAVVTALEHAGPLGAPLISWTRGKLAEPWVPAWLRSARVAGSTEAAPVPADAAAPPRAPLDPAATALHREASSDRALAAMLAHLLATSEVLLAGLVQHGPPDIIHCHDLDTVLAAALARRRWQGVRIIWDSHENWPYINPETDDAYIATFLALERALAAEADAILAVSTPLAEEIGARTGGRSVLTVPNAEIWRGPPPTPLAGHMSELAAGRLKVLFQGSFAPERGLEQVIDAWAEVDGTRAALFLRGHPNAAFAELLARARAAGLLDRSIYALAPVAEDALVAASAEADLGLIPYLKRWPGYRVACPNKLSQFLHAGVPVLANDLPFVAEVLTAGDCGALYDSTVPGSLAGAVGRILAEPAMLARWRRNALAHAEHHFNWQRASEAMLACYAATLRPSIAA